MNTNIIEGLKKAFRHPAAVPTAVGLVSAAAGYSVAAIQARSYVKAYQNALNEANARIRSLMRIAEEEKMATPIEEIGPIDPEVYAQKKALDELTDNPEELQQVLEAVRDGRIDLDDTAKLVAAEEALPPSEEVLQRVQLLEPSEDVWDWEAETARRDALTASGDPYTIHREEYEEEAFGPQSVLTWYEGDSILARHDDKPIYNSVDVVGDLEFGHGSGDPNVVYVRNPGRGEEYEVFRHTGFYSTEVQGLSPE